MLKTINLFLFFFLLCSPPPIALSYSTNGIHPKILKDNFQKDLSPLPAPTLRPALMIRNGSVVEAVSGKNVQWRGLNWFGANVGQQTVDGLWKGGRSTATDFSTQLYTIRLLGFNTLRLSFLFDELWAPLKTSVQKQCTVATDRQILERAVDPDVLKKNKGIIAIPPNLVKPFTPRASNGVCNAYMPNQVGKQRGLDRFLYTVEYAVRSGFYVVLTFHPRGGTTPFQNPSKDMSDQWARLWKEIMSRPSYHSMLKNRVIIDIMNEPDAWKWTWDTAGPMYMRTMNTINSMDKSALFMIEGTGQYNAGAYNWGLGLITDNGLLSKSGVDTKKESARPFFESLINSPMSQNVIVSPHVYGPSISKTPRDFSGPALIRRIENCFGYLQTKGFCSSVTKKCQRFPVVIGEYGSRLGPNEQTDKIKFEELSVYLKKNSMNNWLHWSFNANDGDTGGLLFEDWERLRWDKIRWLKTHYDLRSLI